MPAAGGGIDVDASQKARDWATLSARLLGRPAGRARFVALAATERAVALGLATLERSTLNAYGVDVEGCALPFEVLRESQQVDCSVGDAMQRILDQLTDVGGGGGDDDGDGGDSSNDDDNKCNGAADASFESIEEGEYSGAEPNINHDAGDGELMIFDLDDPDVVLPTSNCDMDASGLQSGSSQNGGVASSSEDCEAAAKDHANATPAPSATAIPIGIGARARYRQQYAAVAPYFRETGMTARNLRANGFRNGSALARYVTISNWEGYALMVDLMALHFAFPTALYEWLASPTRLKLFWDARCDATMLNHVVRACGLPPLTQATWTDVQELKRRLARRVATTALGRTGRCRIPTADGLTTNAEHFLCGLKKPVIGISFYTFLVPWGTTVYEEIRSYGGNDKKPAGGGSRVSFINNNDKKNVRLYQCAAAIDTGSNGQGVPSGQGNLKAATPPVRVTYRPLSRSQLLDYCTTDCLLVDILLGMVHAITPYASTVTVEDAVEAIAELLEQTRCLPTGMELMWHPNARQAYADAEHALVEAAFHVAYYDCLGHSLLVEGRTSDSGGGQNSQRRESQCEPMMFVRWNGDSSVSRSRDAPIGSRYGRSKKKKPLHDDLESPDNKVGDKGSKKQSREGSPLSVDLTDSSDAEADSDVVQIRAPPKCLFVPLNTHREWEDQREVYLRSWAGKCAAITID